MSSGTDSNNGSSGPQVEAIYPLPASQQGMWVQSVADRSGQAFIEQIACRLDGALDQNHLREAWQRVMDRHASLRSAFVAKGNAPLQLVMGRLRLPLQEIVCAPADEAEQLASLLHSERAAGFTLNRPPLIRFVLLRVSAQRHWWLITFHHLILDGWSLAILWREAQHLYRALCTGQPPILPPPADYRNYVDWLKTRSTQADESYWRQHLAGVAAPPAVGNAFPNDASKLPSELSYQTNAIAGQALDETARRCHLPVAALLEVLWAILLAGRSGETDVVFATTISGRPPELSGITDLVGCFINTVPLRVSLASANTLRECLQAHHAARIAQLDHEYCAAGQIHAWSGRQPDQALYASLLVIENMPAADDAGAGGGDLGGLRIGEQRVSGGYSSLPLSLLISPGAAPHLRFVYQPAAIRAQDVGYLAESFERLLSTLPQQLERPVSELLAKIERISPPPSMSVVTRLRPPYVAPRTHLERVLHRLWEDLFKRSDIGVLDDFFALGGHSLLVLQMASRVRSELQLDCSLHQIINAANIEGLAAALASQDNSKSALVPLATGAAGTPIFCPHPLGGHVLCYAPLARALTPHHPCWGLQAPGLEAGEAPAASWADLIEHHWRLLPRDNAPMILFGYSYGGYIALELAERRARRGAATTPVVLFDVAHSSVIPASMATPDRAALLYSLFGLALDLDLSELQALPPADLLPQVHALAIARHVLPPDAPLSLLERLLAVAYRHGKLTPPSRYYDFPVLLLRAREGAERITTRADLGWREYVRELDIAWVDGSHETMLDAPQVPGIISTLSSVLNTSVASHPPTTTD